MTKAGAGALVLGGTNTYTGLNYMSGAGSVTQNGPSNLNVSGVSNSNFTGGFIINAGSLIYNDVPNDTNLGAAGVVVTLNGGTLNYIGTTAYTDTRVFTIGSNGGTINVANGGAAGGKITFSAPNLINDSGTVTKTGPGWLSIGGTESGTGNWVINSGVIETGATGLGSPVSVTVNGDGSLNPATAGELAAANNATFAKYVILNGGILSGDNGTSNYSNTSLQVEANSTIRLGDFWGVTNRSLTISAGLFGSGNLKLVNANGATPVQPSMQILTLSGNNSSFSGTLSTDAGHDVRFGTSNANSLATYVNVVAKSTTTALPVITIFNGNNAAPNITNDPAGTSEGVFAVGGSGANGSGNFNMSSIGGGAWFFGTDAGGVSYYGTLTPGNGNTYRLAAPNGSLFLGNPDLTAAGTGGAIIGDTRLGGTGVVRYGAKQNYTGTTTVNAGTTLSMDFQYSGSNLTNLMPATSPLVLAGGTFTNTARNTTNFSQSVAGTTISPGGNSAIIAVNTATSNNILFNLGAINRSTGGTVNFTPPANGTPSATLNGIVTNTPNAYTAILGGYATVGGTGWATSAGTAGTPGLITALATYNTGAGALSFSTGYNADAPIGTTAPGTVSINSLRFNTAGAYTLSDSGGSTLTITSGGILETSTVGGNAVTISPLNLATGNGADLIIIQNNNLAAMTINSLIGGSTGLTKSGTGALVLNAANTFSGNTYLNGGSTTVTNSLALQNSVVSSDLQAGTLLFGSAITNATIGGLSGNQSVSLSNTNAIPAAVALTVGNSTTNASSVYSGNLSGLGSLIKAGMGTFTMSGPADSYAGTTTVNAGTLRVTGAITGTGALTVNGGGTLGGTGTITPAVTVVGGVGTANQGSLSLVDGGIGTLTLQNGLTVDGASSGSPSNLGFDINATTSDTLALGSSTFTVNAGGANISVNSLVSGSLITSGTTYTLMTFANGTGAGFNTGSGTTVGALNLSNPMVTFGVSGTLNVTSTSVYLSTSVTSAPATAYWSGVQGSTWSATDVTITNGNFTTDPGGLNFVHVYPASTTNVIFAANGNGAPTNLTNTLGQTFNISSLAFDTGVGATTIGGSQQLIIQSGGITVQNGAGPVTLNMASLVLDQSQPWTNSPASPVTVSSNVSGGGTLTTSGNFIMTGTNNYSGGTIVSSGTLQLGGGGSLNSTGNLTVNGALDMNGSNVSIATLSGSGSITNGTGAAGSVTLTSNANSDSNFSGPISDSGVGKTLSLTKNGANSLTLSGGNSYTGTTTLNAGTLVVGNATALGNGAALTVNGGTLDLEAAGSGSGGPQAVSVGSLSGAGGLITDNNGNSGVTTLNVNQSVSGIYAGAISDGTSRQIALSKSGTATLTLTNANNYSGGSTISAGKLLSATPGSIGSGQVTLTGGTLSLGGQGPLLSGFGSTGIGWTTNQAGTFSNVPTPITADVLTLTDNGPNQGRWAFFNTPQTITNAQGFIASFVYTPSAGTGTADGMTFMIENGPNGANILNGTGGSLGASGADTNASGNVAINLYNNVNQTGFNPGGANNYNTPNSMTSAGINLHSGDSFLVSLTYSGTTLSETVTDQAHLNDVYTTTYSAVDFQSLLGGTSGYVGFTGSTGGATSNQTVSNFTFQGGATNSSWSNPVLVSAGMTSGIEVGLASANLGGLTMQAGATLNVSGATTLTPNSAYSVSVGPTNVSGAVTFNVTSNGTGTGFLTLGAVNDGGTASTINVSGTGAVALFSPATSLVDGTALNVGATSTVETFDPAALGTQADVTVASGGMVTTFANATFGSLNGAGSVNLNANTLIVGGTSAIHPNSNFSGNMSGGGTFNVGGGSFTLTSAGLIGASAINVAVGATANINGLLTGTPAVTAIGVSGTGSTINFGPANASNDPAAGILNQSLGSLTIGSGSSVNLATATSHSQRMLLSTGAGGLTIAGNTGNWTGKLELANNDLDVPGGNLTTITDQVKQGFNNGTWTGTEGIVSTSAATDTTHLTALGVIQNSIDQNGGSALYSTFDGRLVANTDVLVKTTYYGDADLSGKVDGTDYGRIDNAFLADQSNPTAYTGWFNGDFNYDGVINGSDYTLIDNAFNSQGASLAAMIAGPTAIATAEIAGASGTSAVPEPASITLLGIAAAGLLGRRRRRH